MAEMKVLQDIKSNTDKIGVLSGLATTVKTDLVSAVNENREQINDLKGKNLGYANYVNGNTYPWGDDARKIIITKVGNLVNIAGSIYVGNADKSLALIDELPNCSTPYGVCAYGVEIGANKLISLFVNGTHLTSGDQLSIGDVIYINITYVSA